MLCHGKSRGVVAYAAQMLTNSTPETSPSFTDVDMGASAARYTVHKIFGHAGEMIADGEGAFLRYYICPGARYAFVSRFQHPPQTNGNEANFSAED